jgi:DNA-binding NtrC family response regulator
MRNSSNDIYESLSDSLQINEWFQVLNRLKKCSSTQRNLLLTGATGYVVELLALLIHYWSRRPGKFVMVDCSLWKDCELNSGKRCISHLYKRLKDFEDAVFKARGGTLFLFKVEQLGNMFQRHINMLFDVNGSSHCIAHHWNTYQSPLDVRFISSISGMLNDHLKSKNLSEKLFYNLSGLRIDLKVNPYKMPIFHHIVPARHLNH